MNLKRYLAATFSVFTLTLSAWASFVFPKICKNGGAANGLIFGLYFGVFAGLLKASWYF
ncbi:MAG: hypothetical protein V4494_05590 [Chlamydiota bacterium]